MFILFEQFFIGLTSRMVGSNHRLTNIGFACCSYYNSFKTTLFYRLFMQSLDENVTLTVSANIRQLSTIPVIVFKCKTHFFKRANKNVFMFLDEGSLFIRSSRNGHPN